MGSAGTIPYTMPLRTMLEHLAFTLARLLANDLSKSLAPAWEQLEADWYAVNAKEIACAVAIQKAMGRCVGADERLDIFVDRHAAQLLIRTNNDRTAPIYTFYYKDKRPSDLRRPILGNQLFVMRGWIDPLKTSTDLDFQKMGMELTVLVSDADTAQTGFAAAQQAKSEFQKLGERKHWVDRFNALRRETYGTLAKMPSELTDAYLPATFADRFFKAVSEYTPKEELTSSELTQIITEKQSELEEFKAQLQETLAREEAEEKKKQDRATLADELRKKREEAKRLLEEADAMERQIKR